MSASNDHREVTALAVIVATLAFNFGWAAWCWSDKATTSAHMGLLLFALGRCCLVIAVLGVAAMTTDGGTK